MIEITVDLKCDDCKKALVVLSKTKSASEIRILAANNGWKLERIHNLELDFCPACQVKPKAATV